MKKPNPGLNSHTVRRGKWENYWIFEAASGKQLVVLVDSFYDIITRYFYPYFNKMSSERKACVDFENGCLNVALQYTTLYQEQKSYQQPMDVVRMSKG